MVAWIDKNKWWFPIAIVVIVVLVAIGCSIKWTADNEKETKETLSFCQENGYLGTDWVYDERVCYGYVEGNQLIVVPVDELKE
jgi:hypothetical protein